MCCSERRRAVTVAVGVSRGRRRWSWIVRRHHAMTTTKKLSIGFGVLVSLAGAVFLLVSCVFGRQVVSRVPVPGSSMTAIVTSDIAGCYSVQLFEHGHPISDFWLLGPYASQKCTLEKVTCVSNIVTINWSDGNRNSVAVNINARRFVTNSNSLSSK